PLAEGAIATGWSGSTTAEQTFAIGWSSSTTSEQTFATSWSISTSAERTSAARYRSFYPGIPRRWSRMPKRLVSETKGGSWPGGVLDEGAEQIAAQAFAEHGQRLDRLGDGTGREGGERFGEGAADGVCFEEPRGDGVEAVTRGGVVG